MSKAVDFARQFLKSNKDHHFNFQESCPTYFVSSGSLILDQYLGGGFSSGLLRFCGASEGGKTSEALLVMHNMLKTVDNSKGLYIKAEGRLSPQVVERSGLTFVSDPDEWVAGTVLVFECNVYDVVFDFIRGLIKNNDEQERFNIIIDSMDGLIASVDLEKTSSDAAKVGAGAVLSSDFCRRVSLGMSKFGHICTMISQIRATIKTSQYQAGDPNMDVSGTGGNALKHYPDWILDFQKNFKQDKILEDPSQPASPTNKILGHYAKVVIRKSTNETTGMTISYPIKHGKNGASSIWIEKEIFEILSTWGMVSRGGSWYTFDEELANKFELPKLQGEKKVIEYFEERPELTQQLSNYIREMSNQ